MLRLESWISIDAFKVEFLEFLSWESLILNFLGELMEKLNFLRNSGGGAGGEDDDNDSQGGIGILHKNLTSSSSALQGLLRKLGAGLDDLFPSSAMGSVSSSHRSGRLKKILASLRANGNEGK
ncbi:hypothetical protein CQW23_14668 [Capsicum baccatum]|uniref:Uncharacterized protein n=1 Tax=Capsicum baccatum TaxID=33114 RepID=A0A2G2WK33_CAPBA|nr:hypothetical protein CQW23_14668 [Capsicum baccatum]